VHLCNAGHNLKLSSEFRAGLAPALSAHVNALEEFYDLVAAVPKETRVDIEGVIAANSSVVTHVGHTLWHLYVVQCEKYAQCISGVIRTLNDRQYLLTGLCCRAFMEHAAASRYVVRKLERVAREATNPDQFSSDDLRKILDAVDQFARGGRFNWQRYLSGDQLSSFAEEIAASDKGRGPLDQPNPNSINVKTAIDDWSKEHAGIALIYAFLCEVVHPNIGSTFLVVGDRRSPLAAGGLEMTLGHRLSEKMLMNVLPIVKEAARQQAMLVFYAESFVDQSPFIERRASR
jgi:hypothetical protein